jgi:hypothetical protein
MLYNNLRYDEDLIVAPYIKIDVVINSPGYTNGVPNIKKKEETRYVLAPSAKKIGTYIRNQLFGSDLLTETEGLDINWLTPTLGEALEQAVYDKEAFIYIHKFDNKIYLENIKKCCIYDLVQKYDKLISCRLVQDYETDTNDYSLHRIIKLDNGNTYMKLIAYRKEKKQNAKWQEIDIDLFNKVFETEYKKFYELPYEVIVNIDIGQDFFKDSTKLLYEEVEIYNTLCEEVEKTKTRIATSQHYQSGDIYTKWQPSQNMYNVRSIEVNGIQDYYTILPGDGEHTIFEFLQGNLRVNDYVNAFKFLDYQVIQMANLSPASFGYEKDAYQNTTSVNLSMSLSEMTIEAIKRQLEPQINKLIENIIKLQELLDMNEKIPADLKWDYGNNEKLDDDKIIKRLSSIERVMIVPYSTRARLVAPILNKLLRDDKVSEEELIKENEKEREYIRVDYGEI